MAYLKIFSSIFFILIPYLSFSQSKEQNTFKNLLNESELKDKILFMSDTLQEGRATGSSGSEVVKEMIITNFKVNNLKPLKSPYYTQSFRLNSIIGRNIIGYIPASIPTDKCLIIGAHYDNIGKINNKIYPGADANASGTAALLCLSKIFGLLQANERPQINIIFVAFDAKELSLAGSTYFANNLPVKSEDIICAINIDQIGSILAPPNKNPNYILVLGRDYLPSEISTLIPMCNFGLDEPLDIDYTFYGSKAFLNTFYKLSDHYPLHKKNIPAIMFTAGINKNNYKITDTEKYISYKVFINRIQLIYRIIYRMAYK